MEFTELIRILKTAETAEEIDAYREQIARWFPRVRTMFEYDQQNKAHQYDLWMHCLHTVVNLPRGKEDGMLYLAAMLHDIGKPDCQVAGKREEDKDMHYYGHPERSYEIVRDEVLPLLQELGVELTGEEQERLLYYVHFHDDRMSLRLGHVRRHIRMVSFEEFQKLMLLQVADAKAHVGIPVVLQRVDICTQLAGACGREFYERILNGE